MIFSLRNCLGTLIVLVGYFVLPCTADAQTGTWSPPVDLSDGLRDVYNLDLAVSPDGTKAAAVWYQSNGVYSVIRAATATVSSGVVSWSGVSDISANTGNASEAKIAISDNGTRATAIWRIRTGSNSHALQARSATITSNIASWGATYSLSTMINPFDGQIALSSDGSTAAVVWTRWNGSINLTGFSIGSIIGNSGTWSTSTDISVSGESSIHPQVAISSDGSKGLVIWSGQTSGTYRIKATPFTVSSGTPTLGTTATLSDAGNGGFYPGITLSADGTQASAVWSRFDGSLTRVQSSSAAIASNQATWGAPNTIDLAVSAQYPDKISIRGSADGARLMAAWSKGGYIQATFATASATTASWSTPVDVSGPDSDRPHIARANKSATLKIT